VRHLEDTGVISGYVALVNPDVVSLSVAAFVRVRLDQQDDSHLAEFEEAIAEFPEVMECFLMSGDADYQMRVLVSSPRAFEEFLRHRLTRVKGVANVTISLALRPVICRDTRLSCGVANSII
jgi:Lrp/AsnC family leucine-responsive transcriptional regulator